MRSMVQIHPAAFIASWGAVASDVEAAPPGGRFEDEIARPGSLLALAKQDWESRSEILLVVEELRTPQAQRFLTRKLDRLNRETCLEHMDESQVVLLKASSGKLVGMPLTFPPVATEASYGDGTFRHLLQARLGLRTTPGTEGTPKRAWSRCRARAARAPRRSPRTRAPRAARRPRRPRRARRSG